MTIKNVDLGLLWLILAALVGTYVFLFGFLRNINEWYYVVRLGKIRHSSLPPGDLGWPFIGDMISFLRAFESKDHDSFINKMIHRYGQTGIYKTNLFGNPTILVCTPELCKKVLADDEQFIPGYPSSVMKLVVENSLSRDSVSDHKRLRKLLIAPINGHETLSVYIGYIEEIVVSTLENMVHNNSPIELLIELKHISFNVITKIFMGSTDYMPESMTKYYTIMSKSLLCLLPIDVPGFAFHEALKARKILVNMIRAHVDERRYKKLDDPNTRTGMIDLLLEAEDEDGKKLEIDQIVNSLLKFLLAGHETTAHATLLATIYLHDHPEILQRAKEEQIEIIERRPSSQKGLTLNEIRQMEYLYKVISETLRLWMVPSIILRKATNDVKVDSYIIPKGWKVLICNRTVHMNPEIYSNPNEFLPSRWDNPKLKPESFIPFGSGTRTCPGADLAKIEMSIFLHYFLLNYKFERINPSSPIRFPTPSPVDNCLARITKLHDHQL